MTAPHGRTGGDSRHRVARILVAACLLAMICAVSTVRSAEPSVDVTTLRNLSIEEIMEIKIPTVYGASKHEQKITDAPSSVSIVPREEIQAFGHRTLAEILRSVRDFYVSYDRNYGYIGVRGFNRPGDFGGRILLLIDGHRVNDPIYNTVGVMNDFPVDVDMIERVEVIRGPGSSLYGNNAVFAVINVVTRRAQDVDGTEISGDAGSLETFKGRASFGHTFKSGLAILLTGTLFDSGGNERLYFEELDRPETNHGIAERLDAESSESAGATFTYKDFTLQAVYGRRVKEVPTASYDTVFNHPAFQTVDQNSFIRLGYAHDFDEELSVRGDVSWSSYNYSGDYPYAYEPAAPRTVTIFRDTIDAQWWRGEFQVNKRLWKSHLLTLGAEFQANSKLKLASYDVAPRAEYLRLQTATSTSGIFLQDEWTIAKELALNIGGRYDFLGRFGGTFNPRTALIYHPWKQTTAKLLYGRAFRAPNVYESSYATLGYQANPDLRPELIHSYEAVLEQSLSASWRLSASVFHNQVTDLISETFDQTTEKLFFANVDEAKTTGASVELEAKLPRGITTRGSYTFQNTTDAETGMRLSNSPQNLAKANLLIPLYRDKVFTGLELQYTSDVENSRGHTTDGYVIANWTLFSRDLVKGLEVSGSVYNLFDARYGSPGRPQQLQDTIEQNGRTFRLKFTHRF